MKRTPLLLIAALLFSQACAHKESAPVETKPKETKTYKERRGSYQTKINHTGPIIAEGLPTENDPTPEGFEKVTFKSGDIELWGWLSKDEEQTQKPVLIYFHGHYALRAKHMPALRQFVDAGFRVFAPTLRGRNQNEGSHQLLYGEIDDAKAAINFIATQTNIDAKRIYTFGHSLGGGLSALLAFYDELPLRITASCGAIYSTSTFASWAKNDPERLIRFDTQDKNESELRVLLPHAQDLALKHIAYMGETEKTTQKNAAAVQQKALKANKDFSQVIVQGNHSSALKPALEHYLKIVMADSAKAK